MDELPPRGSPITRPVCRAVLLSGAPPRNVRLRHGRRFPSVPRSWPAWSQKATWAASGGDGAAQVQRVSLTRSPFPSLYTTT